MLGPLHVIDGERTVSLGPPKQRALLALLLIRRNEVLATDRIIDALWGEDAPPGALKTLHVYVAGLRKTLEPARPARSPPERLVTRRPGYTLRVEDAELDAVVFEQRLVAAEELLTSDPRQAAAELHRASNMWRGRPYEDVAYESFAQGEIRRLEELRLRCREVENDAELLLGHHHALVSVLEALVREHPLHEPFWAQLTVALYRSGRQPDALRAYQRARTAYAEMGVEPSPDLENLESRILLRDPDLDQMVPGSTGNLPAMMSSFIGRAAETAAVCEMVRTHRLVTVSGPGGVGKSRLAVEAARLLAHDFRHGVWLVELAGIDDGEEVASSASAVLGVRRTAAPADAVAGLVEHMADRNLLLVVDNCEHLIDALAGLVYVLLARCPDVRVLATSRHPLGVEGETVMAVEPMPVDAGPSGEMPAAVRLFLDRAMPVRPALSHSPDAQSLATEVCRSAGGLPLAIELAAARLRVMSLDQLARSSGAGFAFLSGGPTHPVAHHHAMHATMDWSYHLLSHDEQALFRRLAVFRGGFTLGMATRFLAAFPGAESDAGRVITGLVDASMVSPTAGNRLMLLEPIRQYALSQLAAAGEVAAARRTHAQVVFETFRVPDDVLFHAAEWVPGILERFEPEIDNIAAALSWAFASGDVDAAVAFTSVAASLLMAIRPMRDAQRWLLRGLAATATPTPARARILAQAAFNAAHLDGVDAGEALVAELASTADELADERWRCVALVRRADMAVFRGDNETAAALYEQAIARLERLGHPDVAVPLNNYADVLASAGRFDDAERVALRMIRVEEESGRTGSACIARIHLGYFAACRGDAAAARRHLTDLELTLGAPSGYAARARCMLALLEDDFEEAERTAWDAVADGRDYGHMEQLCSGLLLVGLVQLAKGDPGAAHIFLSESLREAARFHHSWLRGDVIPLLAAVWAELDPSRGAVLLGAVDAGNRRSGRTLPRPIARLLERAMRALADTLDPAELLSAWQRGAALTMEEAIALATERSAGHYTGAGRVD